jgi:hypothetical protein
VTPQVHGDAPDLSIVFRWRYLKVGFLRTSGLKLRMPVQTYGPDGKRTEHVMLEADLDASRAFTGQVTYDGGEGIFSGGMTLLGNLW